MSILPPQTTSGRPYLRALGRRYPTILSRTLNSDFDKPMLHLLVIQPDHPTVTTFDCVEFLLQTIELKCDLAMLQQLLGFAKAALASSASGDTTGTVGADDGDIPNDVLLEAGGETSPPVVTTLNPTEIPRGSEESKNKNNKKKKDKKDKSKKGPVTFGSEDLVKSVQTECEWARSIAASEGHHVSGRRRRFVVVVVVVIVVVIVIVIVVVVVVVLSLIHI